MIDKEDIGLSILTSGMVFGSWSAWSSSLFTVDTFVDTESKYKSAKLAMDLGLGTAIVTGIGVYYVYGDKGKVAAGAAVVTGLALYLAYYMRLKCNPKLAGLFNDKNKNGNGQLMWKPLAETDLQYVRNLVNSNNGISLFSEP